jgi:hypothetical protein
MLPPDEALVDEDVPRPPPQQAREREREGEGEGEGEGEDEGMRLVEGPKGGWEERRMEGG